MSQSESIESKVARLEVHHDNAMKERDKILEAIEEIKRDIRELREQADRWRGGIAVALGLGGLVVGLVSSFSHVWKFFTGQ